MKKYFKLLAVLMAAILGILCLGACGEVKEKNEDESKLVFEDAEDMEIKKGKVTIANITGKDAVKVLSRRSGADGDWSDNILSQDYLHDKRAVEVTYNITDNDVYDLRMVFEDGSTRDFTGLDFANAQSTIYLGGETEESTAK